MENLWIVFVFIYSILKGSRDGMKKAALKKSSLYEVLFFYTLIGVIFALPYLPEAVRLSPLYVFFIFIKSAVVCTAWGFSCAALRKMSVSLYGIIDLSRMIFSTALGVFILGEAFTLNKALGVTIVIIGLFLVNLKKTGEAKTTTFPVVLAAFLNCFFNSIGTTYHEKLRNTRHEYIYMLHHFRNEIRVSEKLGPDIWVKGDLCTLFLECLHCFDDFGTEFSV